MRSASPLFVLVLALGACRAGGSAADAQPAASNAAPPAVQVNRGGGAWESDPRWPARVKEIEDAAMPALDRLRLETGLVAERGREPSVVFDEAAPPEGDAVSRFVDGVRRPLIRIQPRMLLSGEFRAADDLAPLLARGAILVAAGERDPPPWISQGVAIVVGGVFDRRLHQRALSGETVRWREAELFGASPSDPLTAAARARALARTARTDKPFARLLELVFMRRSEEAALAEMGVTHRDFLDAAADTERSRAAEAIAAAPLLAAVRDARAALVRGESDRADQSLTAAAEAIADPSGDPWFAADARLCLAEAAQLRGDAKAASAALAAARASGKVVRVRRMRTLEIDLAAPADRRELLRAYAADYPDAAGNSAVAQALGVPAAVTAKHPDLAGDLVSVSVAKRTSAATRLGESRVKESAVPLRMLAADPDPVVRAAAAAALSSLLGTAANDDLEAATRDPEPAVRRAALDLLAKSDARRAARRAAEMKDDGDAAVRLRAAELSRTK